MKTLNIKLIIILLSALNLFFYGCKKTESSGEYKAVTKTSKIPNDAIHKNIMGTKPTEPSKENVDKSIIEKMKNMEKQVENNPKDTSKILEVANFMIAAHQIQKGIFYFKKILKIDSKRQDILLQLAIIYANQKKYLKAITVTQNILKINPANKIALYNLGALNATLGKKEKAKNIWENIIKQFPNSDMSEKAKQSLKRL